MQKILLQVIFVKLDIRINSNQKFWAEAEQTTSLNSYCNTWIEGEWFKNLLTQKYFTKKFSYSKVFWPKICLNPNRFEPKFCLENVKKKTSEPVKKTFEVILNEKICCTEHEGDEIRCSQSCLSYYQPHLRNMWQNVIMWGTRSDIAKIVRKKIRFWILQMKTHKVELGIWK